jgi:hypothetical protein
MSIELWRAIHDRFDPEEPVIDAKWRAERMYNSAAEITRALIRPIGEKRFLLIGSVGSGKSTELYRVADGMAKRGPVLFLDVFAHFERRLGDPSALDRVQSWEILFLIGVAVYAAGQRPRSRHVWPNDLIAAFEDSARRLMQAAHGETPEIDMAKIAGSVMALVGGVVGGAGAVAAAGLEKLAESEEWKIRFGGGKTLRDQEEAIHALLRATNALLGSFQGEYGDIVLVIDGLDQIKLPDTVSALFVESTLLGSLDCATVASGPLGLLRRRMAGLVRKFEIQVLANLPVLDREDPARPGPGCSFFAEVVRLRTHDLQNGAGAIPPELVQHLAYYSGGRVREFIRLVRRVALECADRGLSVADRESVDAAIDRRRRLAESGLTRKHVHLLQLIIEDPEHMLPDDDEVEKLLEQQLLLAYPNESEWYFPHPLLTIRKLRIG